MNPEAILDELFAPGADYQRSALDAAVEQREAITPLLLERLESTATDPDTWLEQDSASLLYTLVLLAHFREPAAHEPLLRLARLDEIRLEVLLGDAITELLPAVLWRTSGDDASGLRALLEDRTAYEYCRGAAADALVYGTLLGALNREELLGYFAARLAEDDFAEPGESARAAVFDAMLDLYPEEHETFLRQWLEHGWLSYMDGSVDDLDRVLGSTRDEHFRFRHEVLQRRLPDDVHGYISHWHAFQPGAVATLDETDERNPWDDPFAASEYLDGLPPLEPPQARGTRPKGPTPAQKKRKRKQQKQSRKQNRKRR